MFGQFARGKNIRTNFSNQKSSFLESISVRNVDIHLDQTKAISLGTLCVEIFCNAIDTANNISVKLTLPKRVAGESVLTLITCAQSVCVSNIGQYQVHQSDYMQCALK